MSDESKADVPAWQQAQSQAPSDSATNPSDAPSPTNSDEPSLDQAREFLKDPSVQNASPDKKTEFLQSKGYSDVQISELLSGTAPPEPATAASEQQETATEDPNKESQSSPEANTVSAEARSDVAPIITYPEFLTKSPRPPPLITPSRLLSILTVSGSIWSLLYGTARFVVNPMAEELNDSRADYYAHLNERLSEFVDKLEGAVSEVPYKNGKVLVRSDIPDDNESTASDPTEMFHRDIGTQTSPQAVPSTPSGGDKSAASAGENAVDSQARRLAAIRSSLRELSETYIKRAENTEQLRSVVRETGDDMDKLAYPLPDYTSIHGPGFGRSSEPDDEFKKTKDAIRSAKGLFLSTRSFPIVTGASAPAARAT